MATKNRTAKQMRFIDSYDGNIKQAAEMAGLSYDYARRLVTKSHIREAIRSREQTEFRPKAIATRQERQEFWTENMRDEDLPMSERRKFSELLGKSELDFSDKGIDAGTAIVVQINTPGASQPSVIGSETVVEARSLPGGAIEPVETPKIE